MATNYDEARFNYTIESDRFNTGWKIRTTYKMLTEREANRELTAWQNAEPLTAFRLVKEKSRGAR